MKYVIPVEPEDVASLILTRETLRRFAEMFDQLGWAGPGIGQQIDTIEGMLERAEPTETPALHSVHADRWPT